MSVIDERAEFDGAMTEPIYLDQGNLRGRGTFGVGTFGVGIDIWTFADFRPAYIHICITTKEGHEQEIDSEERNDYFLAHINRGVELLVNRVRGLENLAQLIKAG